MFDALAPMSSKKLSYLSPVSGSLRDSPKNRLYIQALVESTHPLRVLLNPDVHPAIVLLTPVIPSFSNILSVRVEKAPLSYVFSIFLVVPSSAVTSVPTALIASSMLLELLIPILTIFLFKKLEKFIALNLYLRSPLADVSLSASLLLIYFSYSFFKASAAFLPLLLTILAKYIT